MIQLPRTRKSWLCILVVLSSLSVSASCSEAANDEEASRYEGQLIPGVWETSWSETLNQSLKNSNLLQHQESQIEKLCPGYNQFADKRELFWHQLMLSLSWKESLHGPGNWIKFRGGTNDGLFQINPELRGYYKCDGLNMFDAHHNIKCAVLMAERLVSKYGTFLAGQKSGMAAYWQPLRGDSTLNRRNRQYILAQVSEACRTRSLVYHCSGPTGHETTEQLMDEADSTINVMEPEALQP